MDAGFVFGDEAQRVHDSRQIFAGNPQTVRRAQADAEEDGVEFALQLIRGSSRSLRPAGTRRPSTRTSSTSFRLSAGRSLYSATP